MNLTTRHLLATMLACLAEGDLLAASPQGWRRALAVHAWARAGRWYRAALESHC